MPSKECVDKHSWVMSAGLYIFNPPCDRPQPLYFILLPRVIMAFAGGFGVGGGSGEIPVTGTLTDSVQSLQWSPTANHLCAGGWNGEVSENISHHYAKIAVCLFPFGV